MGMFDWYNPKSVSACPFCHEPLDRWQGKAGSNLLLVWEEGKAEPFDESEFGPAGIFDRDRLPGRFEIYTDCICGASFTAVGTTTNGVWSNTELLSPENAVPYPSENEGDFKRRLEHLKKYPLNAVPLGYESDKDLKRRLKRL